MVSVDQYGVNVGVNCELLFGFEHFAAPWTGEPGALGVQSLMQLRRVIPSYP